MKKKRIEFFVLLFILGLQTFAQKQKHLDKPKFAAIPYINYNKSFGAMVGAFGSMYFSPIKKDTISPASVVGLGGMYTSNETWFAFGFTQLYYNKDRFRTVVAVATGQQNFQFYYESQHIPGTYIPYTTLLDMIYAEQLVRVYGRFYTGLDFTLFNVETEFGENGYSNSPRKYLALGIPITYDSRNNLVNPTKGVFSNARLNRFDEAFGSSNEYTKLDIDASYYYSKVMEKVFAAKISISTALGAVPFEAQTVVGGKIIRGYSDGEYRGDQVYGIQTEYRWNFYKKWGSVFFAEMATPVGKNIDWDINYLLPSAGLGIRYMMISDLRLNIGLDAAVGKSDYGIYFRIGEAF